MGKGVRERGRYRRGQRTPKYSKKRLQACHPVVVVVVAVVIVRVLYAKLPSFHGFARVITKS